MMSAARQSQHERPGDKLSRREFFRTLGRRAALAGAAAVAGALALRARQAAGQTCINKSVCRGCPVYDGCGLPQALSRKDAVAR